jgi:hypothetical protein
MSCLGQARQCVDVGTRGHGSSGDEKNHLHGKSNQGASLAAILAAPQKSQARGIDVRMHVILGRLLTIRQEFDCRFKVEIVTTTIFA